MRRRHAAGLVAGLMLVTMAAMSGRPEPAWHTAVYVIGTLYSRHATAGAFDVEDLDRIIRAIDPDVLVLDVSPAELQSRTVWPGKIEYVRTIFPYLLATGKPAYAAEPGEPEFSELSGSATRLRSDLERRDSSAATALRRFRAAVYDSLLRAWQSPADVQSLATEQVIQGLKAHEAQWLGPAETDIGRRWDHVAVEVVRRAAREHDGERVLQLTGLENLPNIRAELRQDRSLHLVDMDRWLRERPELSRPD